MLVGTLGAWSRHDLDRHDVHLQDLDISALKLNPSTQEAPPHAQVDSAAGPALTVSEYEVEAVHRVVERPLEAALTR